MECEWRLVAQTNDDPVGSQSPNSRASSCAVAILRRRKRTCRCGRTQRHSPRVHRDTHASVSVVIMATIGVHIDTEAPTPRQAPDASRCEDVSAVGSAETERPAVEAFTLDQAQVEAGEDNEDVDVALERVLRTPCFEALDGARCSYMYTMQLTCSNVVSTVVTARIRRADQSSTSSSSIQRVKDAVHGGSSANNGGGRPNQEVDPASSLASVYAPQSSQSRKAPRRRRAGATNSKYQAQLPAFRRSLPALPIPISRLNQDLRQVRMPKPVDRAAESRLISEGLGSLAGRNEMRS